ncbi:hypothetical protein GCM10009562_22780 [Nocardioides aquaticus]
MSRPAPPSASAWTALPPEPAGSPRTLAARHAGPRTRLENRKRAGQEVGEQFVNGPPTRG